MAKYMITGGAGFIGSHIAEYLVSLGEAVRVFDNFSTGRRENLAGLDGRVEVMVGDIRDLDALKSASQGVDYVVHHAAEISTVKSVEDPAFVNEVNVGGTINVLLAARDAGAKRVVLASSSAVYGDTGKTAQREDSLPKPLSPYGASKLAGEHYCGVFQQIFRLETVCLRYFNVFGPRQNPNSQYAAVIPKFIDRIIAGQDLRIYGDGEQTRDFVFVRNVAIANRLACTAEEAAGEVINIGSEVSVTVNGLAERLIELARREVAVIHDPPMSGDIKHSAGDIGKARRVLGFQPKVGFDEGLEITYRFFAER